ncbi:LysE family translocator [Ferrovibrio xuzhouensis]|uniref:LysE family translocator n=1 Tax=Ferrovibrio xuzhouensis TaxID=1576914 RepID=A0ABV7VAY5_9PROT
MSLDQIIAFYLFAVVAAVTPGPGNVLLTATGAQAGLWRGLPCLLGVSSGAAALMFAAAASLGGLMQLHPLLLQGMRIVGAAFLLWLAWKIATAPVATDPAPAVPPRPVGFIGAALLQWVNPKVWMVAAGAVATYLPAGSGDEGLLVRAGVFALVFLAAALPSGFVWLAFGAAAQRLLTDPRRQRIFNVAMGVILAGSVALILL